MSRKRRPNFKFTLVGLSVKDALQVLKDIETDIGKQRLELTNGGYS